MTTVAEQKGGIRMATIKCKYSKPYCSLIPVSRKAERDGSVLWSNYFYCDSKECCADYIPDPTIKNVANPKCCFCHARKGQFEKTVKNYEYEVDGYWLGGLKVAGVTYPSYTLLYLEIDGEVLVEEDE